MHSVLYLCAQPWAETQGWSRHQHFGLRSEWLGLYLEHPQDWASTGSLGPRQVQSLSAWLRTCGLVDRSGTETALTRLFRASWPEADRAWQVLWAYVTFRFATAAWYVTEMGLGSWTTTELRRALEAEVPHLAPRTVTNGILELVGLLQRTPVGAVGGQGLVSPTRPRGVTRHGLASPSSTALAHAMRLLFLGERRSTLGLGEALQWPWAVYGCDREDALALLSARRERWLRLDMDAIHCCIPAEALANVCLF